MLVAGVCSIQAAHGGLVGAYERAVGGLGGEDNDIQHRINVIATREGRSADELYRDLRRSFNLHRALIEGEGYPETGSRTFGDAVRQREQNPQPTYAAQLRDQAAIEGITPEELERILQDHRQRHEDYVTEGNERLYNTERDVLEERILRNEKLRNEKR